MAHIQDWRGREIEVARSRGGVLALANVWDNLISTGVRPWPAPELIQKIYQSRQVRAFADEELHAATAKLGFYSDLQSLHSEDAITWSVFGPVIYAPPSTRVRSSGKWLSLVGVQGSSENGYPDTLIRRGPEADVWSRRLQR
jgi:hypothetical protein